MLTSAANTFKPDSLWLLIPVVLVIIAGVVLARFSVKVFGVGRQARLVVLIGFLTYLCVLALVREMVGEWEGMPSIFVAMMIVSSGFLLLWGAFTVIGFLRRAVREAAAASAQPAGNPKPAQQHDRPAGAQTSHLVRIAAKGRGKDRRVTAQCQECDWSEQRAGAGSWPDRQVGELAAKHSSNVVGAVRTSR